MKLPPGLVIAAVLVVGAGIPALTVCCPPGKAGAGSPEANANDSKDSAEALEARRFGHFNDKKPVLFGSG